MSPVDLASSVEPLHLRVMGVVVRLDVPDEETRERLAQQWSRAVVGAEEGAPVEIWEVSKANPASEWSNDYSLTTRVTLAALKATTGLRINLHAGGLADDDSRVLALVGPSGTGKTTATRMLATRLGYVSDETVSVDAAGTVSPHPKPLSLVVDPGRPYDKQQVSPDDIGLLPTPRSGRLARLVVLNRDPGADRGLSRMPTVEGLLALIEQTSSLAKIPQPLQTLLALAESCHGIWRLDYQEFEDHADDVVALLAEDPEPAQADHEPVWHPGTDSFPLDEGSGGHLARLGWVDAVEIGEDLVILHEGKASSLNGLLATLWLTLSVPHTPEELVEAAQATHGVHPDASAIVDQAVVSLKELNLINSGSLA